MGVLISVNSDAHSVEGLRDLDGGVTQARRGWLSADTVLNTRSLPALRRWLKRRRD